ncbi:MAG: baseplate multidomain protein megatron [Sulfitobacter sp.]
MATMVLSATGAALGGSIGGTFAGLSSVAIGRAVGGTLGRMVDQRLLGSGGQAVETGKVDRFRLTNAGEGDAVAQVYGRMRIGGQVIWTSDFEETTTVSGGGKGTAPSPETTQYSYSITLAVALCEGVITRVGRVWADGEEIARDALNLRVYNGSADQLPDPAMEAVEGAGNVPAYRGTAYVVMENLALGQFGNRVPQFSFEVIRPDQRGTPGGYHAPSHAVQGVALLPGTGEYTLATTPVTMVHLDDPDASWSVNVTTPSGKTDFATSLENLTGELESLHAASLVVSWFGDDLRCGTCTVQPKVEKREIDGENMPWGVSGLPRAQAQVITQIEGRPVYGGTPTDQSVIEAINAIKADGHEVMFYPFILMDQTAGNSLPDPYSDAPSQPALPWRGRITLSKAPDQPGSPDGSASAQAEVAAFFGTATAADFTVEEGTVTYSGPPEWSFRRFILHYAALCAAAGGVEAFCIGSELRGLTQIRGAGASFPAVAQLRALTADVRQLLGPETKLSYAADWSEYFGYQPQDGSNDRYFHLDPLWADPNIDFIGIDNYMPLSDWRGEDGHLDGESWGAIYELDYLKSNIEGGEGYDWYYHSDEARAAQIRTPITDAEHGEHWIYRYKDLRGWWEHFHHERIGGQRQIDPTAWIPGSKPFWFTEYGCAAIDKGTNQPNKFLDKKSSESSLPRHSNGARDELIQMQYLRAFNDYWAKSQNNPDATLYAGRMINMHRAFVWAWDLRPFPFFPNNAALWGDGENYAKGHWINGRSSGRHLAQVVDEICQAAGITQTDLPDLHGFVRGYAVTQVGDARQALQPLMLRYGFDVLERDGTLLMRLRSGLQDTGLSRAGLVDSPNIDGGIEQIRAPEAEIAGRIRLRFVQSDADFDVIAEEAVLADEATHAVSASELNMSLTRAEGRQITERWLTEARVARESVRFALPPSQLALGAGDVVALPADQGEGDALYRIDRVEQGAYQLIEAQRIEPKTYELSPLDDALVPLRPFVPPSPISALFLDLPLLRGDELPHAPYVAASAKPWPGSVALYQAPQDSNYALGGLLRRRATLGRSQTDLPAASAGLIDHGPALLVKLSTGSLESVGQDALLGGANLAAIGDGTSDNWELFQFGTADLVAPRTYALTGRLRGQAGSDALMPQSWPAGARFVLLNGAPQQLEISPQERGITQHLRIGPGNRPLDDPSYRYEQRSFAGNGLRPLSPCHLRAVPDLQTGGLDISWLRRSRISADSWDTPEIPLGEESQSYLLRIHMGGALLREEILTAPIWHYSAAAQAQDGATGLIALEVAQISAIYGPGLAVHLAAAL